MIKIMLVDNHRLVREGIRRLLDAVEDFRVVAEAATPDEAQELTHTSRPDVLVIDMNPAEKNKEAVVHRLTKGRKTPVRVLVLSRERDDFQAAQLLVAGASGYMLKDSSPTELTDAVRTVHGGGRFVATSLRESFALRVVHGMGTDPLKAITKRETEILRRLAAGITSREIAKEFSLSTKTVDAHRLHLLSKLGLRNNSELTRFAVKSGLVKI